MDRNTGPASTGTAARHAPKSGAGMARNPHTVHAVQPFVVPAYEFRSEKPKITYTFSQYDCIAQEKHECMS